MTECLVLLIAYFLMWSCHFVCGFEIKIPWLDQALTPHLLHCFLLSSKISFRSPLLLPNLTLPLWSLPSVKSVLLSNPLPRVQEMADKPDKVCARASVCDCEIHTTTEFITFVCLFLHWEQAHVISWIYCTGKYFVDYCLQQRFCFGNELVSCYINPCVFRLLSPFKNKKTKLFSASWLFWAWCHPMSDILEKRTPSPSVYGTTRRFTKSKVLDFWAVSASCPTPSTDS